MNRGFKQVCKLEVLVEHGCSMDNETEIEIDQWRVANNYTIHMFAHLLVIDNNIFQSMQCFDTRAWIDASVCVTLIIL